MTMFLKKLYRQAFVIASVCWLSACVSTEPKLVAPHINLSPEQVFNDADNASATAIDFGIEVVANESDSLENLEALPGVRVRSVNANGSAAAAGLKTGDIVLAINQLEANHPDTVTAILQSAEAGQTLTVKVRRDTTVFDTTMSGQKRVQANIQERYRADPIMTRAGYRSVVMHVDGRDVGAAKIIEIFPKSPFLEAGINPGDTVFAVDGRGVESAQGLVNELMSRDYGDKVLLSIADNDNHLREQRIQLWNPGRRISRVSRWPLFHYEAELSPSTTQFSLLDLWIVSLFKYHRQDHEKKYRVLTVFQFGTGTGELIEGADSDH